MGSSTIATNGISSTPPPSQPATKTYSIASMPGDGIGPEVISAGIQVLQQLSASFNNTFTFTFTHFDWSSDTYLSSGHYIPPGGLDLLRPHDAILFGAVGDKRVPDHISLWSLRLAICQTFQQYANVRPTRILRGVSSPLSSCQPSPASPSDLSPAKQLDWVIIRENTEGEYSGHGGRSHAGHAHETATEVAIFTRHGITRVMRHAFRVASLRPGRHLTVVTKSNAQRHGLVLWDEVATSTAAEFPSVTWDRELVDAMTCRMVLRPESLDTVVASNLHADILSDLAAALAGSIGIAPTSNLDPTRACPSMFEPIHGSAWDIAGTGVANPVGTFWSCAEMVRWLGEGEAADLLMEAVERTLEGGCKTRDLGGEEGTAEVTRRVCEEIAGLGKERQGKT